MEQNMEQTPRFAPHGPMGSSHAARYQSPSTPMLTSCALGWKLSCAVVVAAAAMASAMRPAVPPTPPGQWEIPPGDNGWSTPPGSACAQWEVLPEPIKTVLWEGCMPPGPTQCNGASVGTTTACCLPHKDRNGAVIDLKLSTGTMACSCQAQLPPASGGHGATLDSVAYDRLRSKCVPSEGAQAVRAVVLAEGTVFLDTNLTHPIGCNGCATSTGEAGCAVATDVPWPWVQKAVERYGSKCISMDASHCAGSGGGATFGLDGSLGLTGPEVGASVSIPFGPDGSQVKASYARKLVMYATGCATPPATVTEYDLSMLVSATGRVALVAGSHADLHCEAIVDSLKFMFDTGQGQQCQTCGVVVGRPDLGTTEGQ